MLTSIYYPRPSAASRIPDFFNRLLVLSERRFRALQRGGRALGGTAPILRRLRLRGLRQGRVPEDSVRRLVHLEQGEAEVAAGAAFPRPLGWGGLRGVCREPRKRGRAYVQSVCESPAPGIIRGAVSLTLPVRATISRMKSRV